MELGELSFNIKYQPGKSNVAADASSHVYCASVISQCVTLVDLHEKLCHPGVSRLLHFSPFQLKLLRKYVHLEKFVLN